MHRQVALALAAAALLTARPLAAAEPVRVAILPVVVHALDDHDYLREGLADMLASRIGRAEGVAVVRVDDPEAATTDPATARERARALGAAYVVYGSFTTFGQGASLDVECTAARAGGQPPVREIFVQSGTLGEIIPRLDGLAEKVARFASTGERQVSSPPPERAGARPEAAEPPAAGPDLQALLERVEALERAVFTGDERVEETDLRREQLAEDGGEGAAPTP